MKMLEEIKQNLGRRKRLKTGSLWVPVAHAYKPNYSGGSGFEASLDKYFVMILSHKYPT
jgi:hypothetical protein